MTYLLILILHTAAGYAVDRIEAPSYAAFVFDGGDGRLMPMRSR